VEWQPSLASINLRARIARDAPGPIPTATARFVREQVADEEIQARSVLREVRHALNEFRDNRWEAIVRVRNQFVCTMILTGLIMYVLLQFAILAGAPQATMIAATAFFLLGGMTARSFSCYTALRQAKNVSTTFVCSVSNPDKRKQ